MNIVLLASADRGVRCAQNIAEKLGEEDKLCIFTFDESPWEPPFVDKFFSLLENKNVTVKKTTKVGNLENIKFLREFKPDIMFMIGWRYLVPTKIINLATIGCFTFHDSLLPKYRGFSPTVWALLNGEKETGVTLFQTVEGMDEGDIFLQSPVNITSEDDIGTLTEKVTKTYISLLNTALTTINKGEKIPLFSQDETSATYTCKRIPEDNKIDWSLSAKKIHNLVRASTYPYPGAFTFLNGVVIKVWSTELCNDNFNYVGNIPGRVISIIKGKGVVITTGNGRIMLKMVGYENKPPKIAHQIIKSISCSLGTTK
jgi:methionyl-tRNA formyltransferase